MSWRLRTDVDLGTGTTSRYFTYEDQNLTLVVPEDHGFLLLKEMLRSFPDACRALVDELDKEASSSVPAEDKPIEEEDEIATPLPLKLPEVSPKLTLGDMAPRKPKERDVPQG